MNYGLSGHIQPSDIFHLAHVVFGRSAALTLKKKNSAVPASLKELRRSGHSECTYLHGNSSLRAGLVLYR